MKFIDNLTNWYVRTNRKRLKGEGNSREDCLAALETLFSVLFVMIRVFAPFTPFLTEHMYQTLRLLVKGFSEREDTASVHFLMIPQPREDLIDVDIERAVARMQAVVELGRVVRDRRTMPIKYPLPELVVIHKDQQCLDDVCVLQSYVLEELNVKKLTLSSDKKQYGVSFRAEPDHKTLGLRLKGAFKDVMKEIKAMSDAQVAEFLSKGSVTLLGHELGPDDVRIMYSFGGSDSLGSKYEAHSDNDLLVLLDCTPDQSMLDEGTSREVMNRVQKLRKKAGLVPSDQVTVYFSLEGKGSTQLEKIISEFREAIETTTKSPIRPLLGGEAGKLLVEDTFPLKETKLNLKIIEGFCSDFVAGSEQQQRGGGGGTAYAPHGNPGCRFVNVVFEDGAGVVLLENPAGCNVLKGVDELKKQAQIIFGLGGADVDIDLFEDSYCKKNVKQVESLHGKTLFMKTQLNGGKQPTAMVTGDSGSSACCCKFVKLQADGKASAVLLLENPVGSPLDEYAAITLASFGCPPNIGTSLFKDQGRKSKVAWTKVKEHAGKTLYV